MTALSALWLPILVSAVAVFVVSSIIHMTPLWHKSDYPRYQNEDRVLDALRPLGMPPGDYLMPRPANPAEMRSPEFKAKMQRGPALLLTVMPPWSGSMVSNLSQWFAYCLVVRVFAGYIAGAALPPACTPRRRCRCVSRSRGAAARRRPPRRTSRRTSCSRGRPGNAAAG